ncbi:unnamed protein product [Polarella glacialis]|uniref:Pentatricopeptide repeat-containing protein, chloroplastic n=1 Tax=Polarella glacialis TaxID=89957 RepID=A0A813DVH6_POLGL|nr:unnamed protein product [Polarella glacialis]CAE8741269.1 unnamed protein product [Polarella glacialis]
MLASFALEQPVRLGPPKAFLAEALQKASGQPANTGSFLGSRAGRRARCSPREVGSNSDGRKLAQSSLILQQLLDLGRTPGEDEVSEILSVELDDWRRNPRRATVILSSLAKHKLPRTATYVLTAMMAKSVEANVFHYNAAISACEKGRQWQLAVGLLGSMPDMRVIPDEVSYNAAISACEKGGQWQLAMTLLNLMPEARVVPNKITFSAAITACSKDGQWRLALNLLSLMPEARVVPDEFTYSAAISACEKGGQWQLALNLLSLMPEASVVLDQITYSAAISACGKGGQWRLALNLLSSMPEAKVVPDKINYNAAISACEKGGQWQLALNLLSLMPEATLAPNEIAYSAAISAGEKGGQWQLALHLLSVMTKELRPDVIHYTAVMTACRRGGQWLRALELFNSMGRLRVDRNLVTYREAIGACETGLNWAVALDLLGESTQRANLELSGSTAFQAAVELCHACRHWAMALELITALLGRKVETCATLGVPYVHVVQAGSSLDCFKHVVLVLLLQQMVSETTEFTYVDTHAGRGVYDLTSQGAMRFQNFEDGLLKMDRWRAEGIDLPSPIAEYLAKQRGINRASDPSAALETYFGSPVLAQQWLRPQDRMLVFDVSPDIHAALETSARHFAPPNGPADVRVLQEESYNWLMQAPDDLLSGPGLVLIDPPYEPYSEYMAWNLVLLRRLRERWPTSCIAVWFPCFDAEQTTELYHCVRDLQLGAALVAELTVRGLGPERVPGSGMLLVNPPAQAAELLETVLPFLGSMLEQKEGSVQTSIRWISPLEKNGL